jgi:hypothetical protein
LPEHQIHEKAPGDFLASRTGRGMVYDELVAAKADGR